MTAEAQRDFKNFLRIFLKSY